MVPSTGSRLFTPYFPYVVYELQHEFCTCREATYWWDHGNVKPTNPDEAYKCQTCHLYLRYRLYLCTECDSPFVYNFRHPRQYRHCKFNYCWDCCENLSEVLCSCWSCVEDRRKSLLHTYEVTPRIPPLRTISVRPPARSIEEVNATADFSFDGLFS